MAQKSKHPAPAVLVMGPQRFNESNLLDSDFEIIEELLNAVNSHKKAITTIDPSVSPEAIQLAEKRKAHFRELSQIAVSNRCCQFVHIDSHAFEEVEKHPSKIDKNLVLAYDHTGMFCVLQSSHLHVWSSANSKHFIAPPLGGKLSTSADFKNFLKKNPHATASLATIANAIVTLNEKMFKCPENFLSEHLDISASKN